MLKVYMTISFFIILLIIIDKIRKIFHSEKRKPFYGNPVPADTAGTECFGQLDRMLRVQGHGLVQGGYHDVRTITHTDIINDTTEL